MIDATNSTGSGRLGLIAGGGTLPAVIANAVAETKPFVIRLNGFADHDYSAYDMINMSVGEIGTIIKSLKSAHCTRVCFAGYVTRPNFKDLKVDAHGLGFLPKAIAAAREGDDAILRAVIGEFEKAGFEIIGPDVVLAGLAPRAGVLGAHSPSSEQLADISKAFEVAEKIGAMDIGQGAVVAGGLVLAVEAQEGTDLMLDRVAALPDHLGEGADDRKGVLAKIPKPIQELRVDLPTIGPETVRRCRDAGLAGIALQADRALILERELVIKLLDDAGMFLIARDVGTDG
jgi:DUF1009 family protein